jgi:hypothetical protein
MAGFLYYLPEFDRSLRIEDARDAGLGYAFDRGAFSASTFHASEPFGGEGVIFADPEAVSKVGFYPGQTWRPCPGRPFWVGYYDEARPGPADLARGRQLAGHYVRLADGADWLVPVARGWSDDETNPGWFHAVPRLAAIDEAGEWISGDVVPEFRQLWELAVAYWDARAEAAAAVTDAGGEGARAAVELRIDTFGGLLDAAAFALGTNYRLSKWEIAALGLFDTSSPQAILDAVVDGPTFARWLEKKTTGPEGLPTCGCAGSNTHDGPGAELAATGQP